MKDWRNFGIKVRNFPDKNYRSIWKNLKTIRTGTGVPKELDPMYAEFYDISIGSSCKTGRCPFCYASSNPDDSQNSDIIKSWRYWMRHYLPDKEENGIIFTEKPFQVAIGGRGEPTEHPEFSEFLEDVWSYGVVPNYTTNGVILGSIYSNSKYSKTAIKILDYTSRFVGGVAVSFGNPDLKKDAENAIKALLNYGNTNINIHHIISDKKSVEDFLRSWDTFGDDILYHVLLPLMNLGRSEKGFSDPEVFDLLITELEKRNIKNVAFGSHFYNILKTQKVLKIWDYPPESLSKHMILDKGKIIITQNSFDLTPLIKKEYGTSW